VRKKPLSGGGFGAEQLENRYGPLKAQTPLPAQERLCQREA